MAQGQFNFSSTPDLNLLPLEGDVFYHGPIFSEVEADTYLRDLQEAIPWAHDEVYMFGKTIRTDRQMAWFGDPGHNYCYSGKDHQALPWLDSLRTIKTRLESLTQACFNSCLANLYQHGDQGMGWHQDNETELGPNPTIASISFGAERRFDLRHKESRQKVSVQLEHGSLLIMGGPTQSYWQHQLPKTKKVTSPRINLTFRTIHR